MAKPNVYSSGDYAGITAKNFSAYYGYEHTDENDEWCFVTTIDDKEIKIPFSKLQCDDMFNCTECLMMGIAWLFQRYGLVIKAE